jgi:hypothetical protein
MRKVIIKKVNKKRNKLCLLFLLSCLSSILIIKNGSIQILEPRFTQFCSSAVPIPGKRGYSPSAVCSPRDGLREEVEFGAKSYFASDIGTEEVRKINCIFLNLRNNYLKKLFYVLIPLPFHFQQYRCSYCVQVSIKNKLFKQPSASSSLV